MTLLSILTCTIEKRKNLLDRLVGNLSPQLNGNVEFLIESDNGEKTIGLKRNILLDRAKGKYIAFIDDDDLVSNDYVQKILNGINSGSDCCSLEGMITFDGKNPKKFIHSLKYKTWFEQNNIYYRCPNHLNAVKREIALQVKFPENNFGEDKDYSTRLLPYLKSEFYIRGTIYYYHYVSTK